MLALDYRFIVINQVLWSWYQRTLSTPGYCAYKIMKIFRCSAMDFLVWQINYSAIIFYWSECDWFSTGKICFLKILLEQKHFKYTLIRIGSGDLSKRKDNPYCLCYFAQCVIVPFHCFLNHFSSLKSLLVSPSPQKVSFTSYAFVHDSKNTNHFLYTIFSRRVICL